MKPVVATLRKLGIQVFLYSDDMLLMANSQDKARDHFQCAVYLLTALGFVLNVDKCLITKVTDRVCSWDSFWIPVQ